VGVLDVNKISGSDCDNELTNNEVMYLKMFQIFLILQVRFQWDRVLMIICL
jgi:hypothetical protein